MVVAAGLAVVSMILFQAPHLLGRDKVLTDFDAFYIAGGMADQGRAADTYYASRMMAAQSEFSSYHSFMPWTYPPPYTLFVEQLSGLPVGAAYLLFITVSFIFYMLVLHHIAGRYFPGVLIAIFPTIVLLVRSGQNGFLTGGLVGLFLVAFAGRRVWAGIPLGLMIIKPHLAVGISLMTLLGWRVAVAVVGALVVTAALLVSTMAFGTGIWPAFMNGVQEAGRFLAEGHYPLFRMTSIYASVRSFGGSASLALAVHATGAAVACGVLLLVWFRAATFRTRAAVVCVASLFISPYNYDYDLTIMGVAIAFLLPDFLERTGRMERFALCALCWLATGYGLALSALYDTATVASILQNDNLSLMAPMLLVLITAAYVVLKRPAIHSEAVQVA